LFIFLNYFYLISSCKWRGNTLHFQYSTSCYHISNRKSTVAQ